MINLEFINFIVNGKRGNQDVEKVQSQNIEKSKTRSWVPFQMGKMLTLAIWRHAAQLHIPIF